MRRALLQHGCSQHAVAEQELAVAAPFGDVEVHEQRRTIGSRRCALRAPAGKAKAAGDNADATRGGRVRARGDRSSTAPGAVRKACSGRGRMASVPRVPSTGRTILRGRQGLTAPYLPGPRPNPPTSAPVIGSPHSPRLSTMWRFSRRCSRTNGCRRSTPLHVAGCRGSPSVTTRRGVCRDAASAGPIPSPRPCHWRRGCARVDA